MNDKFFLANCAETFQSFPINTAIFSGYYEKDFSVLYITKVYVLIFITGVFSESTVRGLKFYSDSHPSFKDTARYIKFILNIWKIKSLKSPSKDVSWYSENHVTKMYLGTLQFFTNHRL